MTRVHPTLVWAHTHIHIQCIKIELAGVPNSVKGFMARTVARATLLRVQVLYHLETAFLDVSRRSRIEIAVGRYIVSPWRQSFRGVSVCLSVSIFPDLRILILGPLTSTETCWLRFLLFLDGVVEKKNETCTQYTPEID